MAFPRIAAFARLANGSEVPTRIVAGQKTLISRAMHDVAYDEVNDELMIANPFAQAILTFPGGADGEEPPLRVIQGPLTQIVNPDYGVGVDPVNNELYVVEDEFILVFPRTAVGNVAPVRVIRGPKTRISGAKALAVDLKNNVLVVSSEEGLQNNNRGRILIFDRTANGNVAPLRVIEGPKTGIVARISHLRVTPKGWIVTALRDSDVIGVWSIQDNGDIPPQWTLGGPKSKIPKKMSVTRLAIVPKAKEVVIGGGGISGIRSYYFPEIF